MILLAVLAGIATYYSRAGQHSVMAALRKLNYEEAVAAIDRLNHENSRQLRGFSRHMSPSLVDIASEIRLTDEGTYRRTHEFFVEEFGVFILRRGIRFDPTDLAVALHLTRS